MVSATVLPRTWSRDQPKVRSAAGLNSVMQPSWSMVTMQSNADSRMALLLASLERVLSCDPGIGVVRHADAGYPAAINTAEREGLRIPMREADAC